MLDEGIGMKTHSMYISKVVAIGLDENKTSVGCFSMSRDPFYDFSGTLDEL